MEEVKSLSVFAVPIFCLSLPEPPSSTVGARAPQPSVAGGVGRGPRGKKGSHGSEAATLLFWIQTPAISLLSGCTFNMEQSRGTGLTFLKRIFHTHKTMILKKKEKKFLVSGSECKEQIIPLSPKVKAQQTKKILTLVGFTRETEHRANYHPRDWRHRHVHTGSCVLLEQTCLHQRKTPPAPVSGEETKL